jgi:hypothetical protein
MLLEGSSMTVSGGTATAATVVAAPETGGASLLLTPLAVAETAAGIAMVTKSVSNAGKITQAFMSALSKSSTGGPPKTELHRPYLRKDTVKQIEANAPRDAMGRPIDPNTGKPIEGKPDIGHKTGHEFWREQAKADAEGLTQEQFNERMQDPDLYQLEDPASNRSHQFEQAKTE